MRMAVLVASALLSATAFAHHDPADPLAFDCPEQTGLIPDAPDARPLPPLAGLRVGLALGSGSVHGLAHIGVIEALEARGVDVKVVSGTSAGAVVGSLWASGMKSADIEAFANATDFERLGEFAPSWQGLLSNDDLRR